MILEDRDDTEQPKARRRRFGLAGCLILVLALLLIIAGGGYLYVGTSGFAEFVRNRVERNLEGHLQRDVSIGRVRLIRGYPARIFIEDLRVANVPGGVARDFAFVRQIEIVGGIQSFRTRTLDLGKIYVRGARINFEMYPEDHLLDYNSPRWIRSKPRKYEITRMYLDKLFISGLDFSYNDMRRDMQGEVRGISSEVSAKFREGIYQGIATAPTLTFRIQDYEPLTADLRASYYYRSGSLALRSVALRGRGLEAFLSGKIEPLSDAVYDLRIVTRTDLARLREVFRVERPLAGPLALDMRLRGKAGQYHLTGAVTAPKVTADVYNLADLRGKLNITDKEARIRIDTGRYGGGTLSADYVLTKYAEPYPMNVVLDYRSVSLEKLFEDWEVHSLGLRGMATGELHYSWNKDLVLEGRGRGQAQLQPGTVAFGDAAYPLPVGGRAVFALNRGVVTFAPSTLRTRLSEIGFAGSFAIESTVSDLRMDIRSSDFAELDRIGFNVARSADKNDYELLGLGGSGTIVGTVRGPLDAPDVVAKIVAQRGMFNNVVLGDGELELRYAGKSSLLTFDRAQFRDEGGTIAMTGTVAFPDRGPTPILDLELSAEGYSVERAMKVVELDLIAQGTGTGSLHVTGTPDNGKVRFENLRIARNGSQLRLNGDVDWAPGEGNVVFNLDVGADSFPVEDIAAFLEFGPMPVTGEVTGTLHLDGHKSNLQGAGSIIVRNGSIYGEPVDIAMADLVFTEGLMRATHFEFRAPAGTIAGEAEVNLANETFSYVIRSSQLDPTKLKIFKGMEGIFSGPVVISSSGAGPFDRPEIVFEAFAMEGGTLLGRPFPEGDPPKVYFAVRDGQITVQGGAFGIFSVDGSGLIAENGDLSGAAHVTINDIAGFLRTFAPDAGIPAEGNLVIDFQLGGNTGSLERIEVAGTIPVFSMSVAGQPFTIDPPARFGLRNGRVEIESFALVRDGASFSVEGGVGLTGDQNIDLKVRGILDAALLQIFMPDFRARGKINIAAGVGGTMKSPALTGSAEILDGQLKIAGFPQLIDQINGSVNFQGNRISLGPLRAVIGGGNVTAGGSIDLDGLQVKRFTIPFKGTDVALRYFEGVTLDGDFELVLAGNLEQSVLQGNVVVDRAVYTRDFNAAQAVLSLLLERRGLVPEVAASWQNSVLLRMKFSAPGSLAVKNNIANVTGTAEFDVSGTLANPILLGNIEIDEGGRIRIQDVDYTVTRGTVAFQNPFKIDPYFDITAEGRVQEYELTVNLSGTTERIQASVTSDPPISDLTVLSLLGPSDIGQQSSSSNGMVGTDSLQRAGTSLLYSSLGSAVGKRVLPFTDSFRVDAGMLEGSSSPEPTVSFEKLISNDLRVIVVYNTADHDKDRQIAEWQASPRWVTQLTREGDNSYQLEARFRRRYSGYWGGDSADTELSDVPSGMTGDFTLPRTPDPLPPGEIARLRHETTGTMVSAIDFRTDAPYDPSHLTEHIPLKVGEPLTIRGLQDAISRLYGTGDFRDIRVDSAPADSGVALTFVLSLNYRVSEVTLVGGKRDREDLLRRSQVRVGGVLSLSRVDRGAELINTRLRDLGYLEAVVDPETRFIRELSRAEVVYHVERGEQARVGAVEFTGDTGAFKPKVLADATRSRPGWVYRPGRAGREVERITEFLAKRGYRRAGVKLIESEYDEASNRMNLRYSVELGPKVDVVVEGVPERSIRKLLPMRGSEPYSTDAIDHAADRILDEYQKRGYFRVGVDTEEKSVNGVWLVTYRIDPGAHYELRDVLFEGNQKLTDKKLGSVVATAPVGGFRKLIATIMRRDVGITQEDLNDDRDSLEAYYRLHGFPDVEIEQPVAQTLPGGTMDVVFTLREGPQTIVREVLVEGNEKFRLEDLPDLQLKPGEPFNQQIAAADVGALQDFYAGKGHVELQVSALPTVSADKTAATVTYRILEGPEVKIGGVSVRGNTYTDRDVILRTAGLQPGKPFTYRDILSAQRDLYRAGMFRRVDLLPEIAGTDITDRDVVIEVEEGRNLAVAGSVGYSTDEGATFSGSVAHRNLFGTGRYLGLETRFTQETERYYLTYREPFTFNTNIPTQVTIFRTEEQDQPEARFESWGTFVEVSKVVRETTRWALRYEYRISNCVAGALCDAATGEIPIPEVPREDQEIQISSITPSWFWDRRDDPFTPRRGFLASASLEYAFPFLGATAEFTKGFGQTSWYRAVGPASEIVLSSRVGLAQPQNQTVVPFSERFVAGGESSHRAFDYDELGIEGETLVCIDDAGASIPCVKGAEVVPLGGNALVLINAEYRFPLFGQVRGALFVDAGNVWRDLSNLDFGQLRYGTGVGVRYVTPVGPLRLDFGYKLDREPWEDAYAITITIGYPF